MPVSVREGGQQLLTAQLSGQVEGLKLSSRFKPPGRNFIRDMQADESVVFLEAHQAYTGPLNHARG